MLSNTDIAELFAQQAECETGILSRAFRRAARSAFFWPEQVSDLVAKDRPLTDLRSVGPFIGKQIKNWIARDHGTRISLGTDAHHPWQMEFIALGLAAVPRAKLSQQQIVNFMAIAELKRWIRDCARSCGLKKIR